MRTTPQHERDTGAHVIETNDITVQELETKAAELGLNLPIEQTAVWAGYQATIDGRTPWGAVELTQDGRTIALVSLFDYETHGYHYLRSNHAPVWIAEPDEELEGQAIDALAAHVRAKDKRQKFMRISIKAELASTTPVLSGIPYDHTVVIDVTGGDEEILSRMKPRGRRDVRKALRESPVTCADETELAPHPRPRALPCLRRQARWPRRHLVARHHQRHPRRALLRRQPQRDHAAARDRQARLLRVLRPRRQPGLPRL